MRFFVGMNYDQGEQSFGTLHVLNFELCSEFVMHFFVSSEMGAHFSPCGRFLAACVTCLAPQLESEPRLHRQVHHNVTGMSTSPTRHPISTNHVMYELRIYSLEETTYVQDF